MTLPQVVSTPYRGWYLYFPEQGKSDGIQPCIPIHTLLVLDLYKKKLVVCLKEKFCNLGYKSCAISLVL